MSLSHRTVLPSLLATLLISACAGPTPPQQGNASEPSGVNHDTLAKVRIDSLYEVINTELRKIGRPSKIGFTKYSPTDSIDYYILESGIAYISSSFHVPDLLFWPTFFLHDSNLILVRYRELETQLPDTSAMEVKIYLDGDQIVYCEERDTILRNNSPAAILLFKPHTPSRRKVDDIRKLYADHLRDVLDTLSAAGVRVPGLPN